MRFGGAPAANSSPMTDLKILIVADHASARFGGEAVLPVHYFRELRARGLPVWLLTHARTRDELRATVSRQKIGSSTSKTRGFISPCSGSASTCPNRSRYLTTGFLSRVCDADRAARRGAKTGPRTRHRRDPSTDTGVAARAVLAVRPGRAGRHRADERRHGISAGLPPATRAASSRRWSGSGERARAS